MLWVYGKHGCGKSHLAARVIDELESSYDSGQHRDTSATAIAYVYCSPQDSGGTSSENLGGTSREPNRINLAKLLGSILWQLVEQLPLSVDIRPLRNRLESKSEAPTGREMREMILSTMTLFPNVFLVVDGLDECQHLPGDQFEGLCKYIRSLTTAGAGSTCAKVIVFSRPEYPKIEEAFAGCARVQVDAGANDSDIKEFIAHKVSNLKKASPVLDEVKAVMFERADGMFLWVRLLVEALKELDTTNQVRAAVKDMPDGLNTVYALSMDRIWGQSPAVRKKAMKTLLWVASAMRPLLRRELLDALSTEPQMDHLDDDSRIDDDSGLAAQCADLIILKNGQYHLLHSSLKEYLDSLTSSGSPSLEAYQILRSQGEKTLASTCLTYLCFKPFQTGPVATKSELELLKESNPFLEYAAWFWGEHLAKAKVDARDELSDQARCFLRSDKARELSLQASDLRIDPGSFIDFIGGTNPLHALAIFKIQFIAESLEGHEAMISKPDSTGFFPMDFAMLTNNREMCTWFLQKHSESHTTGPATETFPSKLPALHAAAGYGWDDITTKLIGLGFDVNLPALDSVSAPLHLAAEGGEKSTAQILLRADADVNALTKDGRTPLLIAAENAHSEVVDLLLQNGADVTSQGSDKMTALHYVARSGDVALTRKVLELGADVDSVSSEGIEGTPLHYSLQNGASEIVSLLLDHDASTEARTKQGNTPFLLACSWGQPSCLRILLERGAQAGVQNESAESGLHMAALNGHANVLQILLEAPPALAFLDVPNEYGNTPLMCALLRGHTVACKVLLDHGARTDVVNTIARPPLHVAIEFGEMEIGVMLMEQYGADVKQTGWNGETALQCAARFGRVEWISLLLSRGVDPEGQDATGDRAAHRAVDNGQLAFLTELAAAWPRLDLLAKNKRGHAPLHKASFLNKLNIVEFLVDRFRHDGGPTEDPANSSTGGSPSMGMPMSRQLSLALHDADESGRVPLHFAAASGGAVLEYLLRQGADVKAVDKFGCTPLITAIVTRKTEAAKILLIYNADMTATDKQGRCALGFAIEQRLVGLVKILLDKRADAVGIPDIRGERAVHHAAFSGHPRILDSVSRLQEDVARQVDNLGRSALHFAAILGHTQLIEPLLRIGICVDGSPAAEDSPLCVAVKSGHRIFAKRLLEKTADVDRPSGPPWGLLPLHVAILHGQLHTARVLLQAGANPTVRDVWGFSALDYAHEHADIRSAIETRIPGFRPPPAISRSRRLRAMVAACSSTLKDVHLASPSSNADYRRIANLLCLALTLLRLEGKEAKDNAKICFTELSKKDDGSTTYWFSMTCQICGANPIAGTRYTCKSCPLEMTVCSKCFRAFLDPEVSSSQTRNAVKELHRYETEVKKARIILEPLLHTGSERIQRVVSGSYSLWRIKKRLKSYDAWVEKHNSSGQFLQKGLPGWRLLKLLVRAEEAKREKNAAAQDARSKGGEGAVGSKKAVDGKEEETAAAGHRDGAAKAKDGPSNDDSPWDAIDAELFELYADHDPNLDVAKFDCFEHSFMEVHDGPDLLSDAAKINFDANGRLTPAFFQRLEEEYSPKSKYRGSCRLVCVSRH